MTAITTDNEKPFTEIEGNTASLKTKAYHVHDRRATDKFWILLFVVALLIIISPWSHDVHNESNEKIDNNSITAGDISESVRNVTAAIASSWNYNVSEYVYPSFFTGNHDGSGWVVTLVHLLLCTCLIIYAFTSMRPDDFYCAQLRGVLFTFMSFTALYGITAVPRTDILEPDEPVISEYLWALPLVILLIIWLLKVPRRRDQPVSDAGVKDVINWNDFKDNYPKALLLILAVVMFAILIAVEEDIRSKYNNYNNSNSNNSYDDNDWEDNSLSLVGGLAWMYVILTIYYFLLMLMSCATSVSFERRGTNYKDFFRALFVVVRYHFGSVCYQATLILPRIHSMFIMFGKEFRENKQFSAVKRFYLTQWKVHDLSLVATAAHGHNHAESAKELLRLFTSDSPKLNKFQNYILIHRCISALVIGIHGLILITFWTHGVTIEPLLSIQSWCINFTVMILTYTIMRLFDSSLDVLWFHQDDNVIITF